MIVSFGDGLLDLYMNCVSLVRVFDWIIRMDYHGCVTCVARSTHVLQANFVVKL